MTSTVIDPVERGRRIRELRKEKKLTIESVADYLGINKSTFSRHERGQTGRMNKATLEKLAILLDTSCEYLQFGMGKKTADSRSDYLFPADDETGLHSPPLEYIGIPSSYNLHSVNVYTQGELGGEAEAGKLTDEIFEMVIQDDSMLPRIRPGDLMLVRRSPRLTPGKVNVILSSDGRVIMRDVENQEGFYLLKRRDGGEIMIVDPSGQAKSIKQVIGFGLHLQSSDI